MFKWVKFSLVVLPLFVVCGCRGGHRSATPSATSKTPAPKALARVSDRPGNKQGTVPILMYHHFGPKEGNLVRSYDNFRKDLKRLYELGFRPVTLLSYLHNKMQLAPGASPVIITMDNSVQTQIWFTEDGKLDPNCGVGIWQEFAKTHPDFPVLATFYILPNGPWYQKGDLAKAKLKLVREWGCELGCHTINHHSLGAVSEDEAKKQIAESIEFVERQGFECKTIAYPGGVRPKNHELPKGFTYKGKKYSLEGGLMAADRPAAAPGTKGFNLYKVNRVAAQEGLLGLTYWLDQYASGKAKPYVQQ